MFIGYNDIPDRARAFFFFFCFSLGEEAVWEVVVLRCLGVVFSRRRLGGVIVIIWARGVGLGVVWCRGMRYGVM